MKVATAAQMAAIDRRAIEELGVPGLLLMENAGRAVVRLARRRWPEARRHLVLAGPGNNGGDGFVAARTLANLGLPVQVFLLGAPDRLKGDAARHFQLLQGCGVSVTSLGAEADLSLLRQALESCDLALDALFGTGLGRPLEGLARAAVEALNASSRPVLAVDVPSGICSDTGRILGAAVRARATVTMGLPKAGLLLHPGAECAGPVAVAEIGFFRSDLVSESLPGEVLTPCLVGGLLPRRGPTAHKGTAGRVLLVVGSERYPGAGMLATEACLRVGAGLAYAALPGSIRLTVLSRVREAVAIPYVGPQGHLAPLEVEPLVRLAAEMQAMCLGSGLGSEAETRQAVDMLLAATALPTVVDADCVRFLAGKGPLRPGLVLTPHPGEMSSLMGVSVAELESDRVGWACRAAAAHGAVVVFKGAPTVVAEPGGRYWINTTGGPVLAQGGTGDVLSGAIAGLLGQGLEPWAAACCGVFLHGLAGDLCAAGRGPRGVLAGEVAAALPEALGRLLQGGDIPCPVQPLEGL
jgi:NAD(P)H-hydrate epimerase